MSKLIITKFAYLKTPKYSWSMQNAQGGSFSNSGSHPSLAKCIAHAKSNIQGIDFKAIDTELVTIMGFTESDEAIESREQITLE